MAAQIWEKKKLWIVTVWLKDHDEDGDPIWYGDNNMEEFTCETLEDAERLKKELLEDRNRWFNADEIDEVEISDEPEEREVWAAVPEQTSQIAHGPKL